MESLFNNTKQYLPSLTAWTGRPEVTSGFVNLAVNVITTQDCTLTVYQSTDGSTFDFADQFALPVSVFGNQTRTQFAVKALYVKVHVFNDTLVDIPNLIVTTTFSATSQDSSIEQPVVVAGNVTVLNAMKARDYTDNSVREVACDINGQLLVSASYSPSGTQDVNVLSAPHLSYITDSVAIGSAPHLSYVTDSVSIPHLSYITDSVSIGSAPHLSYITDSVSIQHLSYITDSVSIGGTPSVNVANLPIVNGGHECVAVSVDGWTAGNSIPVVLDTDGNTVKIDPANNSVNVVTPMTYSARVQTAGNAPVFVNEGGHLLNFLVVNTSPTSDAYVKLYDSVATPDPATDVPFMIADVEHKELYTLNTLQVDTANLKITNKLWVRAVTGASDTNTDVTGLSVDICFFGTAT